MEVLAFGKLSCWTRGAKWTLPFVCFESGYITMPFMRSKMTKKGSKFSVILYYGLEILHRRTCRTSLTTDNELWLWYVDHTKRLKIQAEILYRWTCRTSLTTDKPPTCSSGRMGWLCPTLPGIHCLFVFVFVCLLLQWDSKHYIVSAFLPCQVLQLPTSNLTNSCLLGMTCSQKLDWRGSCPERTL